MSNQRAVDSRRHIQIDTLLDDVNKTVSEYKQNYVRISFAGTIFKIKKDDGGLVAGSIFRGIPSAGKTVPEQSCR